MEGLNKIPSRQELRDPAYDAWEALSAMAAPLRERSQAEPYTEEDVLPTIMQCKAALAEIGSFLSQHSRELGNGLHFGFDQVYSVLETLLTYAHREPSADDDDLDAAFHGRSLFTRDMAIGQEAQELARTFLMQENDLFGDELVRAFTNGNRSSYIKDRTIELAETYVDAVVSAVDSMTDPAEMETMMALARRLYPITKERIVKHSEIHFDDESARIEGTRAQGLIREELSLLMRMGSTDALQCIAEAFLTGRDSYFVNRLFDRGVSPIDTNQPPALPGTILAGPDKERYAWAKDDDARRIAGAVLKQCGLTGDEHHYWDKATKPTTLDLGYLYRQSLENMKAVEMQVPRGIERLAKEFGIRVFGRYPKELLLQQLEEFEGNDVHGVILTAYPDYNGAFILPEVYKQLLDDSKSQGLSLRVVESGSKEDIAKRLLFMADTYGRMDYLIVGGHGTPKSIRFNSGDEGAVVAEDFFGKTEKTSSLVLKDDAPIALSSCSTGAEMENGQKSFAAILSEHTGKRVVAPIMPVGVRSISLKRSDESLLSIDVEYVDVETQRTETPDGRPLARMHDPDSIQ